MKNVLKSHESESALNTCHLDIVQPGNNLFSPFTSPSDSSSHNYSDQHGSRGKILVYRREKVHLEQLENSVTVC